MNFLKQLITYPAINRTIGVMCMDDLIEISEFNFE